MIGIGFFEELAEYGASVLGLVLVLKSGYNTARVQFEKRLWRAVGIDFQTR